VTPLDSDKNCKICLSSSNNKPGISITVLANMWENLAYDLQGHDIKDKNRESKCDHLQENYNYIWRSTEVC
jgi:hypothetical protein